jgi:2-polyprenyl-6-methoxyphenol hydroxylase-like FAD-dependent oxidoreductase
MPAKRHAEIVGAGFAGLAAACALSQRGWSVRVHERADQLRTTGAGIYIYENGLRVLSAVGAYDEAVKTAPFSHTREVRDERNRLIAIHRWPNSDRVFSVVRQQVIDALASAARRAGAEIVTGSEALAATPSGDLIMTSGRKLAADLIVASDGANSKLRDSLDLIAKRKYLPDGAIRMLIDRRAADDNYDLGTTIEYWAASRRVLYTPCSDSKIYVAMTMLDTDAVAKSLPIRTQAWGRWFPHLQPLLDRLGEQGRYDRFEFIKLKQWSSGCVAIVGDAAHALPPNIGQGGGCAMMNALSMAVYLDRTNDVPSALAAWERAERPLTDHTQRISLLLGWPTTWPPFLRRWFFAGAARSGRLIEMRTRTARHAPTGTTA